MNENNKFYDLTYPQKGIWNLEKMYPNTSIGNLSATLKINKNLDLKIMAQALNYIIKKNDALRMRVTEIDGEAKQYITPYKYQKIDMLDFSNKDISELYKWDTKMTREPFFALNSPLFHTAVLKVTEDSVALYVKFHHLIGDAWTLVEIGNDLMIYYQKIISGEVIDDVMAPSYIDYVEKEQKYLHSERFLKDEAFWLNKFNYLNELTTLKPNKDNRLYLKSKRKTYIIPEKLCKKIREHCALNKTSIFSLYISAMALYFNRTRGVDEIVFGTPVLNRSNLKDKKTYGMFISTAPIKIVIDDQQSYNTFAETINSDWLSLLKHQKYPYTQLLTKLRKKNNNFKKLYDIVISYQNAKFIKSDENLSHEGRWHLPGYQTDSLNIHINDRESDGNIIVDYDYLYELFYEKEIDFLHKHVISLLWHSIDNPKRKLPLIEMISEAEKKKILYDFNDTKKDYPKDKTIQELFEIQVNKNPKANCIVFEDQTITYEQYNKKSNQLARLLREKGIRKEDIVSILIPRSIELMIGIMGVIKAGGAYLPLDTDYPLNRTNVILNDSQSKLLLTHSSITNNTIFDLPSLEIDKTDLSKYDDSNLNNINTPSDLLYIIYTSGTTGKPKGVMIEHNSLVNFIYDAKNVLELSLDSKVLSVTTVTFDLFILENFPSLLSGACMFMANETQQNNTIMLKKLIMRKKINSILMTPSRLQMLLDEKINPDFLKNIKILMVGGEFFSEHLYKQLQKATQAKIINMYGPTEATIAVSYKVVNNEINIGKPVNNTKIYILDKHMNLLPIGVPGELCVGGNCLSRGYLNNDNLTNEYFVQNPFDEKNKIYKTGDVAKWYAKGELLYIGRNDSQVKINGYRVETKEIEKVILEYKKILNTIVVAFSYESGKKYLCAYVVCDSKFPMQKLRNYLSDKLPKYMIPSFFVQIDKIPLSLSGKVNIKLLPLPDIHKDLKKEIILSRNSLDKTLTKIWCDLLNIKTIGIDNDFFEMGGDSLSAIQLMSLLYKQYGQLSIQDIYTHPTIRTLSDFLASDPFSIKSTAPADILLDSNKFNFIEQTPLSDLIINKKLNKIDSAAITYIPEDIAISMNYFNKPTLFNYIETKLGNIGLFAIPISSINIYNNPDKLISLCVQAIEKAYQLGAKSVSLTGLIPSATHYGHDIVEALKKKPFTIDITTGHATTAAAVVLSVQRLLNDSNRNIRLEHVAFVGLGSVGTSVTQLLLSVLSHPKTITLCDIYQKSDFLYDFKKQLQGELNFKGEIIIATSNGIDLPKSVYKASLIIGATNVADILDIDKLNPGTLIVDDSGPHCFDKLKAIKRLNSDTDILFTEGGILETPETLNKKIYLPIGSKDSILSSYNKHFTSENEITGCIFSSLLTTKYNQVSPILGTTSLKECIINYKVLKKLKYIGASPHCDSYIIDEKLIEKFNVMYRNIK